MTASSAGGVAPALELRGIVKRFDDVVALDGVDFVVAPGTVHALLGENGAGKSTLMRIADGLVPPDRGQVRLFGAPATDHTARVATRVGVGMVHQHLSLVPRLSVVENFVLGGRGWFRPTVALAHLRETMRLSGLAVPHDRLAADLSIVEQQRLEILKALGGGGGGRGGGGARLLILDEPTSVLAPADIDELLRWIPGYAERGGSVVLVTHKLREALAVADDVTVLRRGQVAYAGSARQSSVEDLARAMFPEPLPHSPRSAAPPAGAPVVIADQLEIVDARGASRIRRASFRVSRHEIVGVAAVEGSGHRDLMAALAALVPVAAGTLQLPTRRALIPADRLSEALIPEFTLTENVALRELGQRHGLMPWQTLATETRALLEDFDIVAPTPRVAAHTLSGGNQQRLVIARELKDDVDLVIADNPTSGLDLRSTAFVHDQLRAAAARGAAVVLHSSDLDEILALATRMLVVFHGEVHEVSMDRDEIGRVMLGAGTTA